MKMPETPGLRTLSKRHLKVVRSIADCLFHDGEQPVPPQRLDWLERDVSDFVKATAWATRFAFKMALLVLQFAPILTIGRPRRLTSLSRERRTVVLSRAARSRLSVLHLLFGVAKLLISMIYFEHPEARRELGYDQRCLTAARPFDESDDIAATSYENPPVSVAGDAA